MVFAIVMLVSVVLFSEATAAAGRHGAIDDAELHVIGELRIDQTVKIVFDLKGYVIPNGSYSSINVRFMDKPEGAEPKIKAGYPETLLVFNKPGPYRIALILNEVSKPSCGGVNAKPLLEKTIEFQISE